MNFQPDSVSYVAQLMELGFTEEESRRGLQESNYQGIEAAVDWIMGHPRQPQSLHEEQPVRQPVRKNSFLLESGGLAPESAVLVAKSSHTAHPGSAHLDHTAGSAHPAVPSRVGQRLLQSIQHLREGIRSDPSVTHLSRQVVTLFLSRRLPNELCWLIFSYTMSSEDIKRIVLCTGAGAGASTSSGTDRLSNYNPYEAPHLSLRASYLTTQALLSSASDFLSAKQDKIMEAKISTPNTLTGR